MSRLAWAIFLLAPLAATAQNFQVSGAVIDHVSNRPLNHVLMSLIRQDTGNAGASASALTESDGRFQFTGVPAGKYRLTAQRRGEMPRGFLQDEDNGFGTAIVVGTGAATENLIFPLPASASITGVVMDDRGEPAPRLQVMLFRRMVTNGEQHTVQRGTQTTNSQGEFHFGRLRPGTFFVAVSGRPWYAGFSSMRVMKSPQAAQAKETDVSYPITWYGNTTEWSAASPIVLAEGAASTVQIGVQAVPNVHVKMPAGETGATVYMHGPGNTRLPVGMTLTGGPQGLELTGFPAGRYEVVLHSQERGGPMGTMSSEVIELTDGAAIPMPHAGQISVNGQVTYAGGERPNSDVEVSMSDGQHGVVTEVADDGTFSFPAERLAAGSYTFHLNNSDFWVQSISAKGARQQGEKIEIPSSGNVHLSIVAAPPGQLASVEGFATSGDHGVAGVMVLAVPQELSDLSSTRRDQSDSDGSFKVARVKPGKYTLVAIENGSQLLYKTAGVIKPYLKGGVSVVVPSANTDPIRVQVQQLLP